MNNSLVLFGVLLALQGAAQAEAVKQDKVAEPVAGTGWVEPATGMELVWVPGGCFNMGSSYAEEGPMHKVCVKGFWMGKYEVTQGQYQKMMGNNPSSFKDCGDSCPVEQVSWNDAQEYISKLSAAAGKQYRLPSESEWEYACRGGGLTRYCGSDNVDSVSWYSDNSEKRTHQAGGKQMNGFGLYDMSGNVWEWVEDSYHDNYRGAPVDGSVWDGDGAKRVIRGGSWIYISQNSRAAERFGYMPVRRDKYLGFRLVRTIP